MCQSRDRQDRQNRQNPKLTCASIPNKKGFVLSLLSLNLHVQEPVGLAVNSGHAFEDFDVDEKVLAHFEGAWWPAVITHANHKTRAFSVSWTGEAADVFESSGFAGIPPSFLMKPL